MSLTKIFLSLVVSLTGVGILCAQQPQGEYHIAYAFPPGWQQDEAKPFDLIGGKQKSPQPVAAQPQGQGSGTKSLVPPLTGSPMVPQVMPNTMAQSTPLSGQPMICNQVQQAPLYTPGAATRPLAQHQPQQSCGTGFCAERTVSLFGGFNWLIRSGDVIFPFAGDMDEDYIAGVSLGKRISRNVRTELEYAYRQNNGGYDRNLPLGSTLGFLESTVQSGMANIFVDLGRCGRIKPYVGLGIGLAHVDADIFDTGNSLLGSVDQGTNFAFQAMGGLEMELRRATFFTEYRYFGTGDVETTLNTEADYRANNFLIGLRWAF